MEKKSEQSERKHQPKGYWIERLPCGEKAFCFRIRLQGEKKAVKMTLKQKEKELEGA